MKRVALALAALAVIGIGASMASAHDGFGDYHRTYFSHPGYYHHHAHWAPPVIVRPLVVARAPVVLAPPVRPYYYGCGPHAGFQYSGRRISVGVGF